ncbi:MAG TPA: hypothetical protein VN781_00755 [Acidimicrobiales bacterium]|nr:hypothetical protein [Acidimicrobiales bacterium]
MSSRQDRYDEGDGIAALTARMARLEAALEALGLELRTRRLVVLDGAQRPRITAEVIDGVAELRVELHPSASATAAVLAFAAPGGDAEGTGLDPSIGVQLWAGGDGLVELVVSPGADGRWRPALHVGAS